MVGFNIGFVFTLNMASACEETRQHRSGGGRIDRVQLFEQPLSVGTEMRVRKPEKFCLHVGPLHRILGVTESEAHLRYLLRIVDLDSQPRRGFAQHWVRSKFDSVRERGDRLVAELCVREVRRRSAMPG